MTGVDSRIPVLEARSITKRFGRIQANEDVSLILYPGRIHGLLGENGAGKSTLLSILYGLYPPDCGQIAIDGETIQIRHPGDAIRYGLGLVQQHFSLIPAFSVLENILLGEENLLVDKCQAEKIIGERLEPYGLDVPLHQRVEDLPVGIQQQVEIAKVLFRRARIMLFDEPTAALVSSEIEIFLKTLVRLREQGIAVVLITHRLPEIMQVADEVTVLRKGRVVLQDVLSNTSVDSLTEAIVGERLPEERYEIPKPGNPIFQIEKGCFQNQSIQLTPLSFDVHEGEILGVASVAGNGQEEMIDGLLGKNRMLSGKMILAGEEITSSTLSTRKQKGMAYIPQDRIGQGLLASHSIMENYLLNRHALPGSERWFIPQSSIEQSVHDCVDRYQIQCSSLQTTAGQLSGGHQQRVLISRELLSKPKLILAHDPTRGLDLRAARFVHEILLEQCRAGGAVILFSSEWSNLFLLCQRIAVLYRGEIVEIRDTEQWTVQEIGRRMVGISDR